MTCECLSPSSLIRSMGSVDAFAVSPLVTAFVAGCVALPGGVGGCWARMARTGSKLLAVSRPAILNNLRMGAILQWDTVNNQGERDVLIRSTDNAGGRVTVFC